MNLLLAGHLHRCLLPDIKMVTMTCEVEVFEFRTWPRVRAHPHHAVSPTCRPARTEIHAAICDLPASMKGAGNGLQSLEVGSRLCLCAGVSVC